LLAVPKDCRCESADAGPGAPTGPSWAPTRISSAATRPGLAHRGQWAHGRLRPSLIAPNADSSRGAVAPNARWEACILSYSACLTTARVRAGGLRMRRGLGCGPVARTG